MLVGGLFLSVFPAGIMGINHILNNEILSTAAKIVFLIGVIIIGFFFVHLAIEFRQDKKIDQYYECGACGSRNLKDKSKWCNVCGCQFGKYEDKMPQDIIGK